MRKTLLYISILFLSISCRSGESDSQATGLSLSDTIELSRLSARPVSKGQNSAAYFTIRNGMDSADTLVAMETEYFKSAELHESYTTDDGLSGMRPVGRIAIPPGDSLVLKPGSFHIMLMQADRSFAAGDSISLTLKLSQSGERNLNIPINSL